ncbi:MAG: pyruvate dehydrogenase [Loktanella sp.]|nr:pyruvate dehydrogenase [Loktanella sp.]
MPLDVIMPALGMAQESGVIVAWHKQPGDAVAEGDVLFEVETDKATMEVEAQGAGFLTGVVARDGDQVPVGDVIARISATADAPEEAPEPEKDAGDAQTATDDLPEGQTVIMPTLGMAQDSGLLVAWMVEPGAKVDADDPLFEVETDKSTVEVPAGVSGYLAAQLAEAGEDVPTGQVIAIISAEAPAQTVTRSAKGAAPVAKAPDPQPAPQETKAKPAAKPEPSKARQPSDPTGRILASPKARRLALEQGLDLSRLVAAGVAQPFHVSDIETLAAMPAETQALAGAAAAASLHLTAEIPAEGVTAFMAWASDTAGLTDSGAVMAGLAGGCLDKARPVVAVEAFGQRRLFDVPGHNLTAVTSVEDATPDLILRDLRATRITGLHMGGEDAPVLSLTTSGAGLTLTLECAQGQIAPAAALSLLGDFAGRLEQPLRHLL